ncbi:unnamed protein product [Blepharisma stoltei]|uniref:Protein kinase domain containing protein n=1 Tax=Blepharisma stoltei TaxID=1481888 RepID=A0AAU9JY86_9CILI|nr:unnamed protein product [Blepharisma stoltei]
MGNTIQDQDSEECQIQKNLFNFECPIGRGGYGKVWKVELKKTKQCFAMKEMSKFRVIRKKSVSSILNERKLLSIIKHPFVVNMQYAFQDKENLYLVMDLMTGGDLRYHICKTRRFTESQAKFFTACIFSGLEYLHVLGIIHRDIKPENLVFDKKGYLRITDFGIARLISSDNSKETSGTPGYMAPEVMCKRNHGIAVDYFALGVIVYELMMGKRPYTGRNRNDIKEQALSKQILLKKSDLPAGWSIESADFVNKLLQRKPENRLGTNGPSEVKNHVWLSDVQWSSLFAKTLVSPFIPSNSENFNASSQFDFKEELDGFIPLDSIDEIFKGYFYNQHSGEYKPETTQSFRGKNRSWL